MGISGVNSTHIQATATISELAQALCGVVLTGGADAATVTVREGGATGNILCVVAAAAGETKAVNFYWPIAANAVTAASGASVGGLHATVTGTTPDVNVIWK